MSGRLITTLALTVLTSAASAITCPDIVPVPELTHHFETVETDNEELVGLFPSHADPTAQVDVMGGLNALGNLVNTGYAAWAIIDSNRAIANARNQYANAIPKGATPFDMEGFSDMQFKSYRATAKNKVGVTVYDLTYTVVHRFNGSHGSKGQFLENVTILPRNIKTVWGYNLDMGVQKTQVVNRGTKEAPIGAIVLELAIKVSTALKAEQVTKLYEFRGDSPNVTELAIR